LLPKDKVTFFRVSSSNSESSVPVTAIRDASNASSRVRTGSNLSAREPSRGLDKQGGQPVNQSVYSVRGFALTRNPRKHLRFEFSKVTDVVDSSLFVSKRDWLSP
jgi:hypothetical protein